MAIAKRVKQDSKPSGNIVMDRIETFAVTTQNGKEVDRTKVAEAVEIRDNRILVPQPDRIVLELEVEEAQAIRALSGMVSGGNAGRNIMSRIRRALSDIGIRTSGCDVLKEHTVIAFRDSFASSNQGTPASANQAGCAAPPTKCGGPVADIYKEPLYR